MKLVGHGPLLVVGLAGCFGLNGNSAGTSDSSSGGSSGAVVDGACSGLPPAVATLLAHECVSCHSDPPVADAPMAMVTRANLIAAAPSDPSRTVAEVSMERMQSARAPMPPGSQPSVTQAELDAFQAWLDAGTPVDDSCDGGAPNGIAPAPTVCTSGKTWPSRGRDGVDMNPGRACIDCHQQEEGRALVVVGGTVYPTVHEPDLCYGSSDREVKVVITDANDNDTTLSVGATGNFSLRRSALAFPIRAKVVRGASERAMQTEQNSGDCNSCHTEQGTEGAPGRIFEP